MALIWIGICVVIGLLGRKKPFGFWFYFLLSLLLSPVVGLVVVLLMKEQRQPESGKA